MQSGFFPSIPVSSTNKTSRHDTAKEKLLNVVLNTIILTPQDIGHAGYTIFNIWIVHLLLLLWYSLTFI
jgi:hypothetical protein